MTLENEKVIIYFGTFFLLITGALILSGSIKIHDLENITDDDIWMNNY